MTFPAGVTAVGWLQYAEDAVARVMARGAAVLVLLWIGGIVVGCARLAFYEWRRRSCGAEVVCRSLLQRPLLDN